MSGMMSEEDLQALDAATAPESDRLFLEQMIAHHRGAVEKVAVVAAVGAIGTYNHFRVVPKLAARRSRVRSARKASNLLRRSAGRETSLMVVIVLITAWLVAASVEG